jgi:MFS family permease
MSSFKSDTEHRQDDLILDNVTDTNSDATPVEKKVLQRKDEDEISLILDKDPEELAANLKLNKKVVFKIDCVILPFLTITMFLTLLDKNCLSYAALYGLKTDNNLKGQDYSWLATIFYMAYLFAQIPVFVLLPKIKNLAKFMAVLLFIWGGILMCMAACTNFAGLMAVRFFLGLFEAAIQPSCIIISSTWYTKKEQPLRLALWSNTFAGIFNGIFGYGFGHWNGALAVWQYMFIVYGAVTMGWGIFCFFTIPGRLDTAWFFNESEKKCAVARTATNQTGIHFGTTNMKWYQIKESLLDPKYWTLVVFIIVQNFINAGITNFNTFIIKGFGYSNYRTMLLATPQAAIAMGATVLCAAISYFVKNIRFALIFFTTGVTMAGIIMIYKIDPKKNLDASLAAVYLCGFYNAPYVLCLSLIASNTSGQTKKAFNSVSVGLFYALGNLIGPQFFLNSQAPKYHTGIKAMLAACCIMYGMSILYAILCYFENRKRDRTHLAEDEVAIDVITEIEIGEMVDKQDLTDHENKHFRYTF